MKIPKIIYKLPMLFMTLFFLASQTLTVCATDANDAVQKDRDGVLQVRLVYTDDNNTPRTISWGSGFLINNQNLITCEHVVSMSDAEYEEMARALGKTIAEVKDRMSIKITVVRDVTIDAEIKSASAEMDFAILTLEDQVYDRTYLPLRSSDEVQQTEKVFALGFNTETQDAQDVQTYTSDDVTITQGQVSKLVTTGTVDYIQNNAKILHGNSGGPLVDVKGNVIGICSWGSGDGLDMNYFYAVSNEQLIQTLNALGIEYTLNSGEIQPSPAPTASPAAPTATPEPQNPEVTDAPQITIPDSGLTEPVPDDIGDTINVILPIAVAAGIIVITAVVVIILKKKPVKTVEPVRYGVLVHKKSGENITITVPEYLIGRDGSKVNYCVSNNDSVGRVHAKIFVQNNAVYITDLRSTNGTFVNDNKLGANETVTLHKGDVIKLADEEFVCEELF